MEDSGSKSVLIAALDDKREITILLAGAADGTLLPSQLMNGRKTVCSHPQGIQFPHDS